MDQFDDTADMIEGRRFPREESVNCYLCGTRREPRRIPVAFGMHAMVAECPACRLAFQTPRPSAEASLAYMNWRWRSSDAYVGDRAKQLRRAEQQMKIVRGFFDRPARLMDFGAGSGAFVRAARDEGWNADGIEQSVSARERAGKFFDVKLGEDWGEGLYDVVTLWDVVEHLRDPRALLAAVGERLSPGGLIFVETGNFENWTRLEQKERWGLYLFDHQYYFTPASLQRVMREAGYEDFRLAESGRMRPSFRLRNFLRHPVRTLNPWVSWTRAKIQWPRHGDIHIMVAVGRKAAGSPVSV